MGKSQQSFNKKEREKKRAKKKKAKLEQREQRKLDKKERSKVSLEDQFMYVDENGNLTHEKPDPTKKFNIKAEDIPLGMPMKSKPVYDTVFRGKVKSFQSDKGYGFITDKITKDSLFVHINDAYDGISENHIVEYEIGSGPKGKKAVNVKRIVN